MPNIFGSKVVIRTMTEKDLSKVASVFTEAYDKADIGERWTYDASYSLINYWFLKQPDLCFVAIVENKIVGGFVAGIKPWWDGNHLIDGEIFVDPAYQTCGIGPKLSKIMYQTALEKYKITNISFITFSRNNFPLRWWRKLGFGIETHLILIDADPKEVLKKLL
ncbi:MAG: GNAT family N-acetyltransferase [Candidatus Pacebacteria bacterium]|nr:GNAT family N-acetyltransferase [Candidatus Paceibacterota bacterium]